MKIKYLISLLLINSLFSLEEVQQISQCGNGLATYYPATSGGNCGFGDITSTIDTAAAEAIIYDGSNGCGICYEVMGEKGSKIVMIADQCPGCRQVTQTGKIHLDLDERIFPEIDAKEKGIIDTSIRMVPCKVSGNVLLHITETNPTYFNAYVTNYKIGVKSLQISINNGKYINVKRETWNRFITSISENINKIKVKIISISGEEIVCPEMSGIIQGEYNCKKQFSTDKFFDLYSKKVIGTNKKSECCKKPSLIKDSNSCNVDLNYNHSNYLKMLLVYFIVILYLF